MPNAYRPHGLWVFFSVDLSGSTSLKVRHPDAWYDAIATFLRLTPERMAALWSGSRSAFAGRLRRRGAPAQFSSETREPVQWKLLGDEVVFFQPLAEKNPIEFLYSVHVLIQVLRQVRRHLGRGFPGLDMPVKGTVWLANEARNINWDGEREFLGPAIDVGFRIKRFAADKKVALSIEAAYLLAAALKIVKDESATLLVNESGRRRQVSTPLSYFDGEVLPGVLANPVIKPYPEILLRILPPAKRSIHQRLISRSVFASDLYNVCSEWIRHHRGELFVPFQRERATGAVQRFRNSRAGQHYDFSSP